MEDLRKKVKDCTIEELENWFRKQTGYTTPKIEIHWYEICFFDSNYDRKFILLKEEEIDV